MVDTVTSTRVPGLGKGGSIAVTITAATFLDLMSLGFTTRPIRWSIFTMVCWVASPWSPLPSMPTTSP